MFNKNKILAFLIMLSFVGVAEADLPPAFARSGWRGFAKGMSTGIYIQPIGNDRVVIQTSETPATLRDEKDHVEAAVEMFRELYTLFKYNDSLTDGEIVTYLNNRGYQFVAVTEEEHPSLIHLMTAYKGFESKHPTMKMKVIPLHEDVSENVLGAIAGAVIVPLICTYPTLLGGPFIALIPCIGAAVGVAAISTDRIITERSLSGSWDDEEYSDTFDEMRERLMNLEIYPSEIRTL